ncbi:malonate transporter subunit MadL [Rhizobium paknamense]|uniref:Malonate transporter MadL subunit n=1 Tax=Rhizobium paknamense TaxID=1206817 RepID=A0ABU0IEL8_9HYPH|nr:malonate transporter subunit MadL [Rhizobium paknamense]MDQ0455664.1 malonate transporter MadL subunit [Rhizobium paknamense]
MVIFGTALLAACYLAGIAIGEGIAVLIGVKANVGGVGIAMMLLIAAIHKMQKLGFYVPETARGVTFWASMYIPVVVAMASTQNVIVAVRSGPLAILAAVLTFSVCFFFVGVINRIIERSNPDADPLAATHDTVKGQ